MTRSGCTKRDAAWRYVGGGCWLDPKMLVGRRQHPCDDEYEHVRTGRRAIFYTTKAAHYSMPIYVRSLTEITQLPGVVRIPVRQARKGKKLR